MKREQLPTNRRWIQGWRHHRLASSVVLLVGALLASPASGATFAVNSTLDTSDAAAGNGVCDDGGGNCTIRAAIEEANAFGGDDDIDVPADTYPVGSDLVISSNITLDGGTAADTFIDGGDATRVFDVTSGMVTIRDVTIQNGSATGFGGGVRNNTGTLTIEDSTLDDNDATSGGGGLVNVGGTVTILGSTFSNNGSVQAAGIQNQASMTITNSTISGNTATGPVGGILNNGTSGGTADLTLNNVTITANGAASNAGGLFNIEDGTPSFATIDIKNSIVSGNSFGGFTPECGESGTVTWTSHGYNIDQDGTCFLTDGTDLPFMLPGLGPLSSNGGPTQTHGLQGGSPALDAIPPANCETVAAVALTADQRGVTRPQGTNCDIGAYEFEPPVCAPAPLGTCTSFPRASVSLKGGADPSKHKLSIKLLKETVTFPEFGDPAGTTSQAICLYDDDALVSTLILLPGGTCAGKPCWKTLSNDKGYKYKNKDTTDDGLFKAGYKAGVDKAKLILKGKGSNLSLPLPVTHAVSFTVQINKDALSGPECWEADFTDPPTKNEADQYKAKKK